MEGSQVIERERGVSEDETSEVGSIPSRNNDKEDQESETETESDEDWKEETAKAAEDREKKRKYQLKMYEEANRRIKCGERIEASNRPKSVKTLLERRDGRHIEKNTLIEASTITLGGADVMVLLLRQNGTRPIHEDVVEAVAKGWGNFKMMEVLVDHQSDLPITEGVLLAAASARPDPNLRMTTNDEWKTVLEILLRHRPGIQISEKVVRAAAADRGGVHGYHLRKALFTYGTDVPITEGIMIETAKQQLNGIDLSGRTSSDLIRKGWHHERTEMTRKLKLGKGTQACPVCLDLKDNTPGYLHSFRLKDFILAMKTGCHYCLFMGKCIDQFSGGIEYALYPNVCVDLHRGSDTSPLQIYLKGNKDSQSACNLCVEIYTHADTPRFAAAIGVRRNVSTNASSEECMRLACRWLNDCNKTHPCPVVTGLLPTRVIRVGSGDDNVSLHVSADDEVARYVALSHCWGNNNASTTTVSNLERKKRGIQWSDLPSTFQDAITITRRLGIDFLWIDSLCIIQDSIEDWTKESAKMTKVYINSTVTIAADGEADLHGGCYAPFDSTRKTRNTSIPVTCVNLEGVECCVYLRRGTWRSLDGGEIAHSTRTGFLMDKRSRLNSRGMTFP